MNKYLIYGLYCPFTDNLHYIGKSSIGRVLDILGFVIEIKFKNKNNEDSIVNV
jgi:hypothetical protein